MEYWQFMEKLEKAKIIHPNEEVTPDFIWDYIICDYDMSKKSSESIQNYINTVY